MLNMKHGSSSDVGEAAILDVQGHKLVKAGFSALRGTRSRDQKTKSSLKRAVQGPRGRQTTPESDQG